MRFSRFTPSSGLLGMLVAASLPAFAQNQDSTLKEIVVTANRIEQRIEDVVADMTVIDRDEIEKSGAPVLADLLGRQPGIQFYRNGTPGSTTNLLMRGADTSFTAVYIDGVRVESQSAGGGATWEAIPVSQIDRIEILRGPAAAVYGSDAIAGVVQIFTRKGEGPFTPFGGVGVGSYSTAKIDAGFSGTQGAFDYSIGVAKEKSGGFNTKTNSNPDKDGYAMHSASTRLGWQINPDHRVEFSALDSYLNSQYDSSKTLDDHSVHELQTLGLTWKSDWTRAFSTRAMITQGKDHYDTYPSLSLTETTLRNYLWQNIYQVGSQRFTANLERREDNLNNSALPTTFASRYQDALALGYELRAGRHTLQLNARHDKDSDFGGNDSGGAAYAYNFTPAWKVTASAGTAFRVPTLYQRFSIYGTPTLQPETSLNREIGLRYLKGESSFGAVAYKNRIDNLITFVSGATGCTNAPGCYLSTKHAELEGVTLTASTLIKTVRLTASYDWLNPQDTDTGKQLPRRASQATTWSLEAPVSGWRLGSELQAFSKRYDDAANTIVLPGYSLINLYATRQIGKNLMLLLRANNIADTRYQLANTYVTAGRNFFASLRWDLR